MYKYYFYITDCEYNSEYAYEGYFNNHFEADKFIVENEAVGNTIVMIAPFIQWVNLEDCPPCYSNN